MIEQSGGGPMFGGVCAYLSRRLGQNYRSSEIMLILGGMPFDHVLTCRPHVSRSEELSVERV